jgi:hypothetical protein
MNNPLFSFVAWICFFKLTFFGLVMCVTSLSVVGKEFSPTAFLFFWASFWLGIASIWLGWWIKRAVTGRKGLIWGWNWDLSISLRGDGKSAFTGKPSMFRWQALFLGVNIITPIMFGIIVA